MCQVLKLPCNYSISHSIAEKNVLGSLSADTNLGISLNYPNDSAPHIPRGAFRVYNPQFDTSIFFYTKIKANTFLDVIGNDTIISLHNSTFTINEYLLSGTLIKDGGWRISSGKTPPYSMGIIGKTNFNMNSIKYFILYPSHIYCNIKGTTTNRASVDIIDATKDGGDNIYAIGTVSSIFGINIGTLFLAKINSSDIMEFCIPLIDNNTPKSTVGNINVEMIPEKIFIDTAKNLLFVIGSKIEIGPASGPGSPGKRIVLPFIVKYDLNTMTYKLRSYIEPRIVDQNLGRFFDMKKSTTTGNYFLGFSEFNYIAHGYVEIDDNLDIISQYFADGTSIHSATNQYVSSSNNLINKFGLTQYSNIHIRDEDNIQFYGWNFNGMAFANAYRGGLSIAAPSRFYGMLLGNNYTTADPTTPTVPLFQYQPFTTSNFKFYVFSGSYPIARKAMSYNNGKFHYLLSVPDSVCQNYMRKDKLLTRTSPISVDYFSNTAGVKSNWLQYGCIMSIPRRLEDTCNGSTDACSNIAPLDYFSDDLNLQLEPYNLTENGILEINGVADCGNNIFKVAIEPIDFMVDSLESCNVLEYNYKMARNSIKEGKKIRAVELYDLLGRNIDLNITKWIGVAYSSEKLNEYILKYSKQNQTIIVRIILEGGDIINYKLNRQ